MLGRTLLSLALIAWIAGCGRRQETVAPPPAKAWQQDPVASTPPSQEKESADQAHEPHRSGNEEDEPKEFESQPAESIDSSQADPPDPSAADSNDPSGDMTYNTGDCDDWPSYELPLVIEIEMLEFPEGVTQRAEPIPDEDG